MRKLNTFTQRASVCLLIDGIKYKKDNRVPVEELFIQEYFCKLYSMQVSFKYFEPLLNYHELDPKKYLDKKITIEISLESKVRKFEKKLHFRKFTGIITDLKYYPIFEEAGLQCMVELTVRPSIHFNMNIVKQRTIFKDKSTKEIVEELLRLNSIQGTTLKVANAAFNEKRVFVTQYEETDFAFMCRLLMEYDVSYFIHYDDTGKELLYIGDAASILKFTNTEPFKFVFAYTYEEGIKQITYPFLQTGDDLVRLVPHLRPPKIDTKYLNSSIQYMLNVGEKFVVKNFSAKMSSDEMSVVYSETHYKDHGSDNNRLEHTIIYHPIKEGISLPKKEQKPRILSTQYALVVGDKDKKQEIAAKKPGMVSINYYWGKKRQEKGKEQKPDVWSKELLEIPINVSVTQLFGGVSGESGYCGAWFMPRIGEKVVVHFLEGDTDKPLITGVVYLEKNTSPYDGKEEGLGSSQYSIRTCSTPKGTKGHELTFEDKKDKEVIYMESSGNLVFEVANKTIMNIHKKNSKNKNKYSEGDIQKENGYEMTVDEGDYVLLLKKGTKEVTLNDGHFNIVLKKGGMNIKVTQGDIKIENTTGNITMIAKKTFKVEAMDIVLDAKKNITESAKNAIKLDGMTISTQSKTTTSVKANTSLNMQANVSASMKGNVSAAVEGSVSASVKGAQTTIEGQAQSALKGAIVNVQGQGIATVQGSGMAALKGGVTMLG